MNSCFHRRPFFSQPPGGGGSQTNYDEYVSRRVRSVSKAKDVSARKRDTGFEWPIYLALLIATLAVYGQTGRFEFVNLDDPDYVTANPHVRAGWTAAGVKWAFTSREAANWFPLTRLSHMLDAQVFGLRSGAHHLVNAGLGALAAMLLFAFLKRATGARWASAFVAGLFVLHPLHVESVAWVAERKDVLSAVFWFLALWAYVQWVRGAGRKWYSLALAAFCCGWMAKPMIVTLPAVLLLLDAWPLQRLRPLGARLTEKVPFFAVSAAGALLTYAAQRGSGAVRTLAAFPLGLRVEDALVSYFLYVEKSLWPTGLAVFYPYPRAVPNWQAAGAALVLAGVSIWTARQFGRRPYLAVGWFWYLITLLPVIGLVQVGAQARADRYMYVPMVGLLVMAAWGARDALLVRPGWRVPAGALAGGALLAYGAAAWAQTAYWENSGTLFRHALEVTEGNYLAEHNLGVYLLERPDSLADATAHLEQAVRLNPDSVRARSDLGNALSRQPNRLEEAIGEYRAALRLDPDSPIPHNNLGNALAQAGRRDEAIAEYQTALRLKPDYTEARANLAAARDAGPESAERHYNLGVSLSREGRAAEAVAEFAAALRIKPDYADAENNLGVTLTGMPERSGEAMAHFRAALRLRPDYADAHYNLGIALSNRPASMPEALQHFEAALKLRPDPELRTLVEQLRRKQ
jgi:tetratricopeptide (TPR) repeat protein